MPLASATELVSATIDPTGWFMLVVFDARPTTRAGMGTSIAPCSIVLADSTVAAIQGGSAAEPSCLWLDDSVMRVQLPSQTALRIGTAIVVRNETVHPYMIGTSLMAGCIGPYDGLSKCASGSVAVQPAFLAVAPTARIEGSMRLSMCGDLSLSALGSSGGGAFPLQYTWSTSVPAIAAAIAGLASPPSSRLFVPSALLPANSSFDITLEVASAERGVASAPASATVHKAGRPLVVINFEGGTAERPVSRSNPISITSIASKPSTECMSGGDDPTSGLQVAFAWQLTRVGGASAEEASLLVSLATAAAIPTRELRIPPNALVAGASYDVAVSVTPVGTSAAELAGSTAVFRLIVRRSPLNCLLEGGSQRTLGSDAALVLRAASSDPDEPAVLPTVAWACVDVTAELAAVNTAAQSGVASSAQPSCQAADGSELAVNGLTGTVLEYSVGVLAVGSLFRFTATATKGSRVSSSSSTVEVVAGTPPLVELSARSAVNAPISVVGSELLVNPSQKLILDGAYSLASGAAGSMAGGGSASFSWVSLSGAPIGGTASSESLALLPGLLSPGRSYTFELSVTVMGATGRAQLIVRGSTPPSGGEVQASPPTGELLVTTFALEQSGWFADEAALPLRFLFESRALHSSVTTSANSSDPCGAAAPAGEAAWVVLAGPQDAPTHDEPYLPLGNVSLRAVAVDVLGSRGCAFTAVEVIQQAGGCDGDCLQSMATDVYRSTMEAVAGNYAARLPQTVEFLAGLVGASATSNASSSDDATRRRLSEGGVVLREGLVDILGHARPWSDDEPTAKLQHTASLSRAVAVPSELTAAAASNALQLVNETIGALQPSDSAVPLDAPLLQVLGSLLSADEISSPPMPLPPPEPPSAPAPPGPPGMSQGVEHDSSRRLSEAIGAGGEDQSSSGGSNSSSQTQQLVRSLSFQMASRASEQIVVGEPPFTADPGSDEGVAFGVVRTRAVAQPVELTAPALARVRVGERAFVAAYERMQLGGDEDVVVELVDFPSVTNEETPPPPQSGIPTPRLASAVVSMRMRGGNASAIEAPPTSTAALAAEDGGEVIRRLLECAEGGCFEGGYDRALEVYRDHHSRRLSETASAEDVTIINLPRTTRQFYCSRDYQCRGPRGVTVNGRCRSRRCECPFPWAGRACKTLSTCAWWSTVNSWQYSSCVADPEASSDEVAVCRCSLAGSFDVAVVEVGGATNTDLLTLNVQLGNWDDVMADIAKNPTILIIVLTVDVLWLIAVIASKCRGNEDERRKNKAFYDFWSSQHKQRVAKAKKPPFHKKVWKQIRGQHKLVRVFYHQYELGEDPAKIPTGAQKATGLAILIQMKMLAISLLWGQAQQPDDAGFTIAQRLIVGCTAAILTMPASVFLDQLFWRAQRVTNSAPPAEGKEAGVTLIARAAMHVAINSIDTQSALYKWKKAVEDMVVAEIQEKLRTKRMVALGLTVETRKETARASMTEAESPLAVPPAVASSKSDSSSKRGSGRLSGFRSSARVAPSKEECPTSRQIDQELAIHRDGSVTATPKLTVTHSTVTTFKAEDEDGLTTNSPQSTTESFNVINLDTANPGSYDEASTCLQAHCRGMNARKRIGRLRAKQAAAVAEQAAAIKMQTAWRRKNSVRGFERFRAAVLQERSRQLAGSRIAKSLKIVWRNKMLATMRLTQVAPVPTPPSSPPPSSPLPPSTPVDAPSASLLASFADAHAVITLFTHWKEAPADWATHQKAAIAPPVVLQHSVGLQHLPLTPRLEDIETVDSRTPRPVPVDELGCHQRVSEAPAPCTVVVVKKKRCSALRWAVSCFVRSLLLLLCCRAPPKRFRPKWLQAWLKVWYSSVPFWRVFPWLVTIPALFGCSFMTLYVAQSVFQSDTIYVYAWCEALGISLCQGWCIQDILVIAVRNNVSCTGMLGGVRSHRYQVFEKFFLAPFLIVKKLISASLVDS